MQPTRPLLLALALAVTPLFGAHAGEATGATPTSAPAEKPKCEHGVQKTLCTRCNPKLAAVFKAKGDWCGEHERPESQCSLCHDELKKKGVKE